VRGLAVDDRPAAGSGVDDHVDNPEGRRRLVEEALDVELVVEVGADGERDAAGTLDRGDRFLTLLSDGDRLTGAYALGPEAGEWLQQATLAIRARVPLDVLRDTIQPFPTFSEIYVGALKALVAEIASGPPVAAMAP
jgi:hypothetical protein